MKEYEKKKAAFVAMTSNRNDIDQTFGPELERLVAVIKSGSPSQIHDALKRGKEISHELGRQDADWDKARLELVKLSGELRESAGE